MSSEDTRLVRGTALTVLALVALRLIVAAITPLTFDEAYYWTWSKHLAGGYYDHPPMVALLIRLGTMVAGDTEFGIRLVSVLLALPMSFAVFRAAWLLFGDRKLASTATLLLNATLMAAAGTTIVTPDAPLLIASAFVLVCLAELQASGRAAWWLGVGASVGAALLSKYTALFFGAAILLWLVAVPELRRWLRSPWPYLGGLLSFAMFSPVLVWNAQHQWMSFAKQLGRARIESFNPSYLAELVPTQFVLATPLVYILGLMGLYALIRHRPGRAASRVLINAMVWIITGYFIWHAVHSRVEANWLGPIYPAFAIAAAVAATIAPWGPRARRVVDFGARWALPSGVLIFLLAVLQANTGVLTGFRRDATVRSVGVGVPEMAREIERVRLRLGASCVLADDYGTTSWLMFYLPKDTCVAQRGHRFRWQNFPEPSPAQLAAPLLLVGATLIPGLPNLTAGFARVEQLSPVSRRRGPLVIEEVSLVLLSGPRFDLFDRRPPG
jgi:4-amino-4-deoxy-L-arabinose transferase-like glycosyltransferase